MLSLLFDFLDLVFQKIDFIGKPLILDLTISLDILNFEILLFELVFQFSNVQLLQLCVSILRPLQILNLSHSLIFKFVFQSIDFDLLQILHFDFFVLQFGDLHLYKCTSDKSISIWIWCSWSLMFKWSKIFFFSISAVLALVYSPSNLDFQAFTSVFLSWRSRIRF